MISADYFDKFKCKCGQCRSVCCGGWGITVSDEEYFRLLGLDCPADLRSILDCALAVVDDPRPERYAMMKPSYAGKCRLINEEGLCSLQLACGEEALPSVCRMYPRSVTGTHAGCSASCERVVELLMREKPLTFSAPLPEPMASYVNALQRREKPLKERIAELLPDVLPRGLSDSYYGLLCAYTAAMAEASERFAGTVDEAVRGYGGKEEALYREIEAFDRRFPEAENRYENLIVNRMFLTDFPGDDIKTALCGIVCEYALLRFASAGCETEEGFVDAAASLYRFIGHTNFNKNSRVAIERCGAYSADGLSALLRL